MRHYINKDVLIFYVENEEIHLKTGIICELLNRVATQIHNQEKIPLAQV